MLEQTRVDGGGQAASARLNEEINQWATSSNISPPRPAVQITCYLLETGGTWWPVLHTEHYTFYNILITTDFFRIFSRRKDLKIGLFRSRFIKIYQDFSRYTVYNLQIYGLLETIWYSSLQWMVKRWSFITGDNEARKHCQQFVWKKCITKSNVNTYIH